MSGFTRVFTGNGTYLFQYSDVAGNTGEILAEVTWIDRDIPYATAVVYTPSITTNTSVEVAVHLNKTILKPEGWE